MAKKDIWHAVGSWAFLVGVILALVLAIVGAITQSDLGEMWINTLIVIGFAVGLLNIGRKEAGSFLMSGIVLILASFFGQAVMSSLEVLSRTLINLLAIFVPAVIIVAVRNVFLLARD